MPQTNSPQPSVVRSQLGALLTQLRQDAELKQSEAAQRAGTDPGTLSRIEAGLRGMKPATAERLLDCYHVSDPAVRDEVLELIRLDAGQRRRPAWWKRHHEVLSPTAFDGYLALEAAAQEIRNYEPLIIPGLLQTPAYAQAVITAMRPELTAVQAARLVEIRMARQRKILGATEPGRTFRFHALIDETALLHLPGSVAVMSEQLEHLTAACDHPQTTVRLSPLASRPHPGLAGAFVIMTLPPPAHAVVCVEIMHRSLYVENDNDIGLYNSAFTHLWERALSPAETCTYLKNRAKENPA
ncbi:helix-turn-helix domain-containing protein [Streptomyces sp. NPDC055078]